MMSGDQPSSLLPSHNVTIISTYGKHFSYSVFTPSSKNSVKSQRPSIERGKQLQPSGQEKQIHF